MNLKGPTRALALDFRGVWGFKRTHLGPNARIEDLIGSLTFRGKMGINGGMNALTVDAATGFLTADNENSFDAKAKLKVLEIARACVEQEKYPRISRLCKAVGIYPQTFYNHLNQDPAFRREWDTVMIEIEELLSESLVRNAQRANGVGAAAFWLKNRMPHRWSDNPGLDQQLTDFGWIKKIGEALSVNKPAIIATDAVITSTQGPCSTNQPDLSSTRKPDAI
jgi:hypothetical protein